METSVSIKEHRIYKYMSEPLRIVGLTLDEIALFMGSLLLFLFVDAILLKLFFIHFSACFGLDPS